MAGAKRLRWLAIAGQVGAPMIGVSLALVSVGRIQSNGRIDGVLSSIYMAGFLAIAVGLRLRRVTGQGWGGALISGIQLMGLALAGAWALITAADVSFVPAGRFGATDIAWPFSHLYLLVVATAAWKSGVWTGRSVWMLALGGLALPVAFAAWAVGGQIAMSLTFGVLTTVSLASSARMLLRV